jgi:ABC-type multidrug transport system fused ATPase/permease subunit
MKECNATVVLVAHRYSTVVNADSICVIDKGMVLEQGNHGELVNVQKRGFVGTRAKYQWCYYQQEGPSCCRRH